MAQRIHTLTLAAGGLALAQPFTATAVRAEETEAGEEQPAPVSAPIVAVPAATTQPAAPPANGRDTLTGDWGGLRTSLKHAGVTVRGDYVSETFSAVDGGQRRGTSYVHQVRLGADFDMDRIAGIEGGIVHVTFNDRRGVGISSDFVGNRLPIQEAAGGYYARLTEASWEQNLMGGKLNLRLGYFAMGNDLGGMPIGCTFVNAAFCAHPLSMSGDSGWYNYPNARWGAAVRYKLRHDVILRTGVYQVNPRLNDEDNAWDPFAGGTIGVVLPVEVEYDPGVRKGSRVLPGHYKIGFYYDTSRVTKQGGGGTVTGRHGFYILADQMIWREGTGNRGLSLFGQFTANPQVSGQITRWYAGGLVKTGTFKGRDADSIGLGVTHAVVDPRLRRLHVDTAPIPGSYASLPAGETAIELSYGFQANRWLLIRPDVQYIVEPGAFSFRSTPNALALGFQVRMTF
ncbi:carbohydrate porin [Sphingomonas sp. IC081]|uniref:carbohydrate porin n=1 Tax=Sphingomonas sp. IC081 TaxID=304378 RepID=UPI00115B611F|nr:carbohydrate porin [Sphingomonas sp. IC081]QDK35006.1 carbohydrate porin [Sphingomonas sp. IC081]